MGRGGEEISSRVDEAAGAISDQPKMRLDPEHPSSDRIDSHPPPPRGELGHRGWCIRHQQHGTHPRLMHKREGGAGEARRRRLQHKVRRRERAFYSTFGGNGGLVIGRYREWKRGKSTQDKYIACIQLRSFLPMLQVGGAPAALADEDATTTALLGGLAERCKGGTGAGTMRSLYRSSSRFSCGTPAGQHGRCELHSCHKPLQAISQHRPNNKAKGPARRIRQPSAPRSAFRSRL
jgi:hypothetical protein